MKLSDLQDKDIVSMADGSKIGRIIDAEINIEGKIMYFIIDLKRGIRNIFSGNNDTSITFEQIKKIGKDVILVEL